MHPVIIDQALVPRVSVGIPLYRSARFLDIIIDNIEAMPKEGIEILISDRHYYDDAIDVLMRRYVKDSRVRFFKHRDELDWVGNINSLFKEARGEYWLFLPHDDTLPSGSLEMLIAALDRDKDAILAYPKILAIDVNGNPVSRPEYWHPEQSQPERDWTLNIALEMFWKGHFDGAFKGLIWRKMIIENNLLIRATAGQIGPERCWLFALCLMGRFIRIPDALYLKRYYPESTSAQWKLSKFPYYSVALTMSVYIWQLIGSMQARLYSIVDVWLNAHRLANSPWQGASYPHYHPAPDIMAWVIGKFIPNKAPLLEKFIAKRQKKVDALRIMILPDKQTH